MDKADIPFLSAADLSRLIQGKEVSPVEAAEAYLERIDSLDFKFNSYLALCSEEALAAARRRSGPSPAGTTWAPCTDSR